jgi:hypothetical protein
MVAGRMGRSDGPGIPTTGNQPEMTRQAANGAESRERCQPSDRRQIRFPVRRGECDQMQVSCSNSSPMHAVRACHCSSTGVRRLGLSGSDIAPCATVVFSDPLVRLIRIPRQAECGKLKGSER